MGDILSNGVNTNLPDSKNIPQQPATGKNDITDHALDLKGDEYLVKEPPPHGLDTSWRRWKCLVCGYVYEGLASSKMVCPKCGNDDPDKFDDAE